MCRDDSGPIGMTEDSHQAIEFPKLIEGSGQKFVDIASGCNHILMLTEDGKVYSFGDGSKGQLGRISRDQCDSIKTNRSQFLRPEVVKFEDANVNIEKIWAGHWCSYALSTNGHLYAWGLNNRFQLGFNNNHSINQENGHSGTFQGILFAKFIMNTMI